MWGIVPFDVVTDYAMWAPITVKPKMLPTSQRNPCPHHSGIRCPLPMESPAHIDRNTQLAGVYCESESRTYKSMIVRWLFCSSCITHVGYYRADRDQVPAREIGRAHV